MRFKDWFINFLDKATTPKKKVYGSAIYAEACRTLYDVAHCETTTANYLIIKESLKYFRAQPEMEDVVFNNKVAEIGQLFERRFKV